jgi:DNA-binding NtrC family response regulator
MRLLVVGTLGGQLTTASKLAMERGATVTHAESNEQALAVLRSGCGADLLMADGSLNIRDLVKRLDAERIHVPIVAFGVTNNARAAINAIHAGAKEYIPLPPDPDLIAAVLAAVADDQCEDLLFRLNLVNLRLPPLRERPADIAELAQYFVKKYSEANNLPVRPLSAEARRALNVHRWRGNERELENTLHRAVLLSTGPEIGVDGIPTPEATRLDQTRGSAAMAHAAVAAEQVTRNLVGRTVAEVERDLILETLKHCLGNRTHAANILGISIRTLRNKLNEYAASGAPIPPHGGEMKGAA